LPNERTRSTGTSSTTIRRRSADCEQTNTAQAKASFRLAQMSRITVSVPPNKSG